MELDTYVLLKAYDFPGKKTAVLHDVCGTERYSSVAGKKQKWPSRLNEGGF
jgi:hypothetical protein